MGVRLPDSQVRAWDTDGWVLHEGFVEPDVLARAQEELKEVYPAREHFAQAPDATDNVGLRRSQFAGIVPFPFPAEVLNRLVVDPALTDFAERVLTTPRLRIYQASLWAKYGRAIDYEQRLHVDYRNHTLVVPRRDGAFRQLQVFLYLSDVTPDNGPTHLVSRRLTRDLPMEPKELDRLEWAHLYEAETPAIAPAGSLLAWGPDVFHRGTGFRDPTQARYMLMVSFRAAGMPWMGHHSWPARARDPNWPRFVATASPRELSLFGFPEPGDPYWNADTIAGVALRYPGLDVEPYRRALGGADAG